MAWEIFLDELSPHNTSGFFVNKTTSHHDRYTCTITEMGDIQMTTVVDWQQYFFSQRFSFVRAKAKEEEALWWAQCGACIDDCVRWCCIVLFLERHLITPLQIHNLLLIFWRTLKATALLLKRRSLRESSQQQVGTYVLDVWCLCFLNCKCAGVAGRWRC